MSANFFKLPESDKRKIWAALLKEWAAKRPPTGQTVDSLARWDLIHQSCNDFTTGRR